MTRSVRLRTFKSFDRECDHIETSRLRPMPATDLASETAGRTCVTEPIKTFRPRRVRHR